IARMNAEPARLDRHALAAFHLDLALAGNDEPSVAGFGMLMRLLRLAGREGDQRGAEIVADIEAARPVIGLADLDVIVDLEEAGVRIGLRPIGEAGGDDFHVVHRKPLSILEIAGEYYGVTPSRQTGLSNSDRALCCDPGSIDRLDAFDDAGVARTPPQPVARLLRGHEFVLVEPGADIVALGRPLAADLTGVARRSDAGAHDIEAAR